MYCLALFAIISINAAESVYQGKGEIYFARKYGYPEDGLRVLYRPENYEEYSPIGQGLYAKIGYSNYTSEDNAKKNYYADVISRKSSWSTLLWDTKGKYYYCDQDDGELDPYSVLVYAVSIYDINHDEIYQDTYHYYHMQYYGIYCEIDILSTGSDQQCSKVFDGQSADRTGLIIAAAVATVLLVIFISAFVVCLRNRQKGSRVRSQLNRAQSESAVSTPCQISMSNIQSHQNTPGQQQVFNVPVPYEISQLYQPPPYSKEPPLGNDNRACTDETPPPPYQTQLSQ